MTEARPTENGAGMAAASEQIGTKRQRRPSVRLGDIGGNQTSYEHRRVKAPWKDSSSKAASRTRHLTNFSINCWFNKKEDEKLLSSETEGRNMRKISYQTGTRTDNICFRSTINLNEDLIFNPEKKFAVQPPRCSIGTRCPYMLSLLVLALHSSSVVATPHFARRT